MRRTGPESGTTTVVGRVDDDATHLSVKWEDAEVPPQPQPKPAVGGRIGDYQLEVLLGQGGMGSVFAARHIEFGRTVAIKVLAEELLEDPTAVPRFVREARMASKLESPHAVRVTDIDKLPNGVPYMVMELLEGETLLASLTERGGVISEYEAIDLIAQACEAAGEAHAMGIVHRDLKLSNLFLTKLADGRAFLKVLDFGLAKPQHKPEEQTTAVSLTQAGSFLGTPHYMAPEQILGSRDITPRSDVWALGVCLYRLVTGVQPFDATSPEKVCMTVLTALPVPPSEHRPVDPLLETIILRCLARRPQDRFADAKELGLALRDLMAAHEWSDDVQTKTKVLPGPPLSPNAKMAPDDPYERTMILEGGAPAPIPPRLPAQTTPPSSGSSPPPSLTPPRQSFVSSAAFSSYAPPPPPTVPRKRKSSVGIFAVVVLVLLALVPLAYLVAMHASSKPAVGMMLPR